LHEPKIDSVKCLNRAEGLVDVTHFNQCCH
jgi:hypothetical protein